MKTTLPVSLFFALLAPLANAAVSELRIDLGENPSTVLAPTPEGNWSTIAIGNDAAQMTLYDLFDYQTGEALPHIMATASGLFSTFGLGNTINGNYDKDWLDAYALDDGVGTYTGGYLEFSGFSSAATIQVEIVSSAFTTRTGLNSEIKVNGSYAIRNKNNNIPQSELASWNLSSAYNNQDWLIWDSIQLGAGDTLRVDLDSPNYYAVINAMHLTVTELPEPSGVLLLGLGAIPFIFRRSK